MQTTKALYRVLIAVSLMAAFSWANADVYIKEVSTGAGLQSGSLLLPIDSKAQNYWAGLQKISISANIDGSSATSYAAYCIDPAHWSSANFNPFLTPTSANNVATLFSTQATAIENLFNQYYAGTLGNNTNAAAFQLALWEVANDNGNIYTGAVRVNGSTNSTLATKASDMLNNLNYLGPNLYDLTVYQVNRAVGIGQNYIVASSLVSPVPEPGSIAFLFGGLLLLGFVVHRNKSKI